jgi:transposase-like protein
MRDYANEHLEFIEKFGTEEQCRSYLYALRWSNGFRCPKCGYDKARNQNGIKYRCKGCRKETSLYEGTIFENTRKPLTTWFFAIWYITLDPGRTNSSELQRIVKLGSNNTALDMVEKS